MKAAITNPSRAPPKKRAPRSEEKNLVEGKELAGKSKDSAGGNKNAALKQHLRDRRFSPDGSAPKMTAEQRERKRLINRLSAQRKRQRERYQLDTLTDQNAKFSYLNGALLADNERLEKLEGKIKNVLPKAGSPVMVGKDGGAKASSVSGSSLSPSARLVLAQLGVVAKMDVLELLRAVLVECIDSPEPQHLRQPSADTLSSSFDAGNSGDGDGGIPKTWESPFVSTSKFLEEKVKLLDATKQVILQTAVKSQQKQEVEQKPNPPACPPPQQQPLSPAPSKTLGFSNPPPLSPPLQAANNASTTGTTVSAIPSGNDQLPQQLPARGVDLSTMFALLGAAAATSSNPGTVTPPLPLASPATNSANNQQQAFSQALQALTAAMAATLGQQQLNNTPVLPQPNAHAANLLSLLLAQSLMRPSPSQVPQPHVQPPQQQQTNAGTNGGLDSLLLRLLECQNQMPQQQPQQQANPLIAPFVPPLPQQQQQQVTDLLQQLLAARPPPPS